MDKKQCLEVSEEPTPLVGAVLHPKFNPPLTDLSPFFQRHYVKGTTDIFIAYGRLLSEITLVLPNQLRKMSEVTKHLQTPDLGTRWIDTLCDFLLKVAQSTGVGRKHVRKLLLLLCGSKDSYRLTRDVHALHSFMRNIREICHSRGFNPDRNLTGIPLNLSYKSTLSLIEHLKACDEVACTRTSNWQTFCLEDKTTLPFLFQTLFLLDEGLAPLVLQLVQVALSGIPPVSTTTGKEHSGKEGGGKKGGKHDAKREGKEKKEHKESKPASPTPAPDKEKCQGLVRLFISHLNDDTLLRFIRLFLLQPNSSSLRWQAHSLIHTLYLHGTCEDQTRVVELLWRMWGDMPTYGLKASQFVDLLGYCTISTPHIMEKEVLCQSYVERAIALLKTQNKMVATHPNSHIYSQLLSVVDFDGYYLENKPCLVCNDPEVPYSVMKLYQMKSEVRYSPNMILFKLVSSFTLSQVTLAISDVKKSKMVKTVNVYYSNRTMQNIIELKNKSAV
jgi:E3 ubiquitin-protein ligase UBR4